MPRPKLAAKSESPTTTTRVSGAGGAAWPSAGAGGAGALVAAADTAAPSAIGPGLSPLAASSVTCWPPVRPARSFSAQLCGLVSTKACAMRPLTPSAGAVTERAIGKAVIRLKRSVIGWPG